MIERVGEKEEEKFSELRAHGTDWQFWCLLTGDTTNTQQQHKEMHVYGRCIWARFLFTFFNPHTHTDTRAQV